MLWSEKPNLSVGKTQLIGRKNPTYRSEKPNFWSEKPNLVGKTQLLVGKTQHYNFLTEIVWKNVGGIKLIHYLCQRYKHIIHLSV